MKHKKFKKHSTSRRKSSGKTTHRRRRVGATAMNLSLDSTIAKVIIGAIGFFKPELLPIEKLTGTMDPKIVAAGEGGLGLLLLMKKKRSKGILSTITSIAGPYMAGAGLKKGLVALGVMSGVGPYGRVPVIGRRVAGPYGNMPVIGRPGFSPNHALNGGYTPSGTLGEQRIMSGIDTERGGSGYTSLDKGSGYMN